MAELDFFGESGFGRSRIMDPSRAINFFFEASTKSRRVSAIGTPGTSLALNCGTGPIRELYNFQGLLYGVSGDVLYYIAPNLTATALGTLNTSTGPISTTDNGLLALGEGGNQMGLVDGTSGYVYNPTLSSGNFSAINSPGFPPNPSGICFMDTYGIVTNGTMGLWTSNSYDLTTWNPIAQAFAESSSDSIAVPVNLNDQLMVVKQASSQAWYDAQIPPSQGSPFLPVPGAVATYGTSARATVCDVNGTIMFLGSQIVQGGFSGVVQMAAFNSEQLVSPPAVDYRISQLPQISDAFSYTLDLEGHSLYVTTFPSANWTLCYDLSTRRWFEWSTYQESDEPDTVNRHVSSCYAFAYNKHWVGDYQNGNIYNLSSSTYNDNGQPIISTWISDLYSDRQDLTNMTFHRLDINADVGYGDPLEPGQPYAELSWSNDSGNSYCKPYPAGTATDDQYRIRLSWRRLGRGKNRVWRLRSSINKKKIFTSAIMRVS